MGKFKFLLLLIAAGTAALAARPDLRNKVLDQLFGAETEFQYPDSEPSAA